MKKVFSRYFVTDTEHMLDIMTKLWLAILQHLTQLALEPHIDYHVIGEDFEMIMGDI